MTNALRARVVAGVAAAVTVAAGLVTVSAPVASAAVGQCTGTASVYGVLADGRLTYSAINAATNTRLRTLTGPGLGFTAKAMATLNFNTILVTSTGGALYRVDISTNSTSLVVSAVTMLGGGWTHDKLTYDGAGHLYGTAGGLLLRYDVTATKPTSASITNRTEIGTGFTLKTLTSTAPNYLLATTSAGQLLSYRIVGANNWVRYELKTSTWQNMTHLLGAGGGVFYGHTGSSGALNGYHDANPTDGSGADISGAGAVDTSGWTQAHLSAHPTGVTCGVTYSMLVSMYGSRVGTQSVVETGLPSLNAEMATAGVTTPARKAAFLATMLNESTFRYDALESGTQTYRGRGFVQLTSSGNYSSAGAYFGVDLLGSPDLARSLANSARIARWYWTVARPGTNAAADALNMGQVGIYIGFLGSDNPASAERLERCADFRTAYRSFTGTTPSVTC
jgi:predicted chitinase